MKHREFTYRGVDFIDKKAYLAALELIEKMQGEIEELINCCERRMRSDEACGHPFDEDMSKALQAFAARTRGEGEV